MTSRSTSGSRWPTRPTWTERSALARHAFDDGPWRHLPHVERGHYLQALGSAIKDRAEALADAMPRESGILVGTARAGGRSAQRTLNYYATLAEEFLWEEPATPADPSRFALIVREPVGVVGAIVPWNGPLGLALYKLAPALLAGCTVVLKAAPEAPSAPYLIAEAADAVGLPPGVLNVVTADRGVSETSCPRRTDRQDRVHRFDCRRPPHSDPARRPNRPFLPRVGWEVRLRWCWTMPTSSPPRPNWRPLNVHLAGQVCASLTRLIVPRSRHDEFRRGADCHLLGQGHRQCFRPLDPDGAARLGAARQRDSSRVLRRDPAVTGRERPWRPVEVGRDTFHADTFWNQLSSPMSITPRSDRRRKRYSARSCA